MKCKQWKTKLLSNTRTHITKFVSINRFMSHCMEGNALIFGDPPNREPMIVQMERSEDLHSFCTNFRMPFTPSGRNGPANAFPACENQRFKTEIVRHNTLASLCHDGVVSLDDVLDMEANLVVSHSSTMSRQ